MISVERKPSLDTGKMTHFGQSIATKFHPRICILLFGLMGYLVNPHATIAAMQDFDPGSHWHHCAVRHQPELQLRPATRHQPELQLRPATRHQPAPTNPNTATNPNTTTKPQPATTRPNRRPTQPPLLSLEPRTSISWHPWSHRSARQSPITPVYPISAKPHPSRPWCDALRRHRPHQQHGVPNQNHLAQRRDAILPANKHHPRRRNHASPRRSIPVCRNRTHELRPSARTPAR